MMIKQEFFARGNECFFFDDPAAVAAYCKEHWPKACAHVLRIADEVCENKFLFDQERDLERTWEMVEFPTDRPIDWNYRPGSDPEFTFQFNRHRFLICLGQAYQLTGNEKYAVHFVRLLMDWIGQEKRSPETEATTWRVLEAGFRGEFWVKAIRYFKDSPALTDEVVDACHRCLVEQAEYLIEMHSPYRYISNWGVIENHGLFLIGTAMPDEAQRKRYTGLALEHLKINVSMAVMKDGVQWEQSPMYHNEVLHCLEDVMILAARNEIDVPEEILSAARKMAYASLAWKKPDGREFLMGDSDDLDLRDMITAAACLFWDPVLKFGGYPVLDFESVWDLGIECAKRYREMRAEEPDFCSAALPDSGNYYLRQDWSEQANLLHFHCGTMGAGHGHSDKLHVDLVIRGEDVLTDSGRYTYVAEEGRFDFKDPPAHNTIIVDDSFFTVCRDSWACDKLCQPMKGQYRFTDRYEFVQGGHLGYMDRAGGVFINRKIIHIKPDLYVFSDELYTGDAHTYRQFWNFSERGSVELEKAQRADSHTALFSGSQAQARCFFLTPKSRVRMAEGKIARHYNRYESRSRVEVEAEGTGFTSFLTVIQGGEAGGLPSCRVMRIPVKSALKGTVYPDSMAEAVKIELEDREYVAVICHQEVNSPTDLVEADGCLGFGNVIVFDKSESVIGGSVLNY